MEGTCNIKVRKRIFLPLSCLSVHHERLFRVGVFAISARTASQNDDALVSEIGDGKVYEPLIVRKGSKVLLDQLVSISKVTILVGCHRKSHFEDK